MDVKMVMRRYSVNLMSLTVILLLAITIRYISDLYFSQYSILIDFFILLASISAYPSIRNYFYHLSNKYFFSSLYDSSEVIAGLSDKLRSTLEAEKIYEYIFNTLSNAFHVKAFGVLTHKEEGKNYIIQYNQGFKIGGQNDFLEDEKLDKMFIKQNKIIVTEEVKRLNLFEKNPTVELLAKFKVEILAPLNVKDKTIGLIALGPKESGDMYNDEDLKVLEVIGAQAAIALENALLYKETKNFNIKLEKEVEKATRDLRKANVQLKKLDAAKSEFISIASHQLRTPLTVIKGYISMMLEGNFGELTKLELESLEKVFESNERLIQLVENLLNISRIESGRLQFDFKEVDLNKMVESVMEELSGNAKKKSLILQYKTPVKPVPIIKLDDEKIRQVVMNLIDNAIKYTKQGSVTVKLEQREKKIKFSVADSGMGIRPEDMINLFKKFSRGKGTSLVHTEGTGLGLYVARMMIEAHHGKIWAESDGEGKGSKFCFELPVK
ncbi:MAG: ATP-binding protein [Patescibacteria group bacterium]|nr:ATP-binding protein [Patescibacteria group bacterium]